MEPPDLPESARRIATVRDGEGCAWITPDALLLLRPTFRPGWLGRVVPARVVRRLPLLYPALAAGAALVHRAYRVEVGSGAETALEGFNRRHSREVRAFLSVLHYAGDGEDGKELREVCHDPPEFAVSPDGRWLLWHAGPFWPSRYRVAALNAEADEAAGDAGALPPPTATLEGPSAAHWLPDGLHWLHTVSIYDDGAGEEGEGGYKVTGLRLFRRDDPEYLQTIAVEGLEDGLIAGITARGTLLMRHPTFPPIYPLREARPLPAREPFSEVELGGDGSPVTARRFSLDLPAPGTVMDVRVSPEGARLAWITAHLRRDASAIARPSYRLWTSDLEARDVREVGRVDGRTEPSDESRSGSRYSFPEKLAWSPDGGRLSFQYGDGLYAVAAPSGKAA